MTPYGWYKYVFFPLIGIGLHQAYLLGYGQPLPANIRAFTQKTHHFQDSQTLANYYFMLSAMLKKELEPNQKNSLGKLNNYSLNRELVEGNSFVKKYKGALEMQHTNILAEKVGREAYFAFAFWYDIKAHSYKQFRKSESVLRLAKGEVLRRKSRCSEIASIKESEWHSWKEELEECIEKTSSYMVNLRRAINLLEAEKEVV